MQNADEHGSGRRHARWGSSATLTYVLRTVYYLAIVVGLLVLYGRGDVSTVGFIYQAF